MHKCVEKWRQSGRLILVPYVPFVGESLLVVTLRTSVPCITFIVWFAIREGEASTEKRGQLSSLPSPQRPSPVPTPKNEA